MLYPIFAIAVDSIECWLLPLLHNDKKAAKITGCLDAANHALRKANRKGLASGEANKFPDAYEQASNEYSSRKVLLKQYTKNPSLEIFVKHLIALQERLNAAKAASTQSDDNKGAEGEKPTEGSETDQTSSL